MVSGFRLVMFIILAASGMLVPLEDFLKVLVSSLYIYVMSKYFYPPVTSSAPPGMYTGSKLLKRYVTGAAYVGLYFPLAYVLAGVYLGQTKIVQTAAPHLFLLTAQVLSEMFTTSSKYISLPARALVPILYNSVRVVSIWDWIRNDFAKGFSTEVGNNLPDYRWLLAGRILAVANVLLWSYNLFCFLLPMYLPKCFRKYFEDEKVWKAQGMGGSQGLIYKKQ